MGAQVSGYALRPQAESLFALAKIDVPSVFADIRDLDAFQAHIQKFKPEIIFHMAAQALVRPSYKNPVETYATNVMGTVNVLEATRVVGGVRALVIVTSDKCYENNEWSWGYRENEPMGGSDPYSSSKGCAELVTSAYRRSYFPTTGSTGVASARAGNVIGGGDWSEDRLIPDCIRALTKGESVPIRNPKSIRPWQHVLEPLSGYLLLAEKLWSDPAEFSQGWNFGPYDSEAKPVEWIADRIVSLWGPQAKWENVSQPGAVHEAQSLKLDCSKARNQLQWQPRLNLEQTLNLVVDWYRSVHKGESAEQVTLNQIRKYEELLTSRVD